MYGQSTGTAPPSRPGLPVRVCCRDSPFASDVWPVAFPDSRKTYCFDAFPSIEKISKVTSPVSVIHGTEDEVIDFSHDLALYELCPEAVEPPGVKRAGRNDLELYAQYLGRQTSFLANFPVPEDDDLILPH